MSYYTKTVSRVGEKTQTHYEKANQLSYIIILLHVTYLYVFKLIVIIYDHK
jgi:hypothetical protein